MQTAVLGFFGVGVAAMLAELLVPGDEGKGTKQALHVLLALSVLLLLLQPLLGIFRGEYSLPFDGLVQEENKEMLTEQYEVLLQQAVSLGSEAELEKGLQQLLQTEYGISPENAAISVRFRQNGELARVEIILSGTALLTDPHALGEDIANRLHCETEVR